MGSFAVP
jgi:hypothetical protein